MVTKPLDKRVMQSLTAVGLAAALSLGAGSAYAQSHKLNISQDQMRLAEKGWSVKKNIMGKAVYNDNNDKIGEVDDLIFSRNGSATFAIIGVGGFLGVGKHDVAVPVSDLKHENDKLVLHDATKDALKAMPEFQYTRSDRDRDNRTSKR
jgi:sporulation protein YlmC with PRC-barrel domain